MKILETKYDIYEYISDGFLVLESLHEFLKIKSDRYYGATCYFGVDVKHVAIDIAIVVLSVFVQTVNDTTYAGMMKLKDAVVSDALRTTEFNVIEIINDLDEILKMREI